MTDFLLELRSEEIPARMQDKARDDLARLFTAELTKAGLKANDIVTFATPRRLALIARDLPLATAAACEELKGPRVGAPPQALEGFLRKTGLTADQLIERDGVLFAVSERLGRATAAVLAEAIPSIIRAFPWPKSMRWGEASATTESLRWVRPLQGIVALFGDDLIRCEVAGISSGSATVGHRFHHPGTITIGSASDYVEKLRACHVVVNQAERRHIIALGATMAARKAGLDLVEDEGLLAENAGLTEWPVPLLGRFDTAFLDVPPEVIQLTARVNQKYFVCRDFAGKLANAFVCTANLDASDDGVKIVEGNRKVLAARLADARFFYETDLKVPLEEQAKKLEKIVFHDKLGTISDKVDRVAKLARWFVEDEIIQPGTVISEAGGERAPPSTASRSDLAPHGKSELAALAERAARLSKADLVSGMVGEFPELQGLMGGYYATAQGEEPVVAAAVRDHYKPVGQGDDVPNDLLTVAVSLADKLDTLVGFFANNEKPTGSRDPFALRRAALGVIQLITNNNLRISLRQPLVICLKNLGAQRADLMTVDMRGATQEPAKMTAISADEPVGAGAKKRIENPIGRNAVRQELSQAELLPISELLDFFADRLKVQQREAGVRHDLIDAVFALGGEDDLVRLLARVHALQSFVGTEDGANLLAGYKRASNILKKEGYDTPDALTKSGASKVDALHEPSIPPASELEISSSGSYAPEKDEAALSVALDAAEPAAADAAAREDFEAAMAAMATLRAPIDAFFESVTVNDPDAEKRASRLALLARVRNAVHKVADFSKIEG